MVKEILQKKWSCPYCLSKFDEFKDAEDCAEDCFLENHDADSPVEDEYLENYSCEYCLKEFDSFETASNCESEHVDAEDTYFVQKLQRDNFEALKTAASHKHQQKIHQFFS